jgi:hypothetical protein
MESRRRASPAESQDYAATMFILAVDGVIVEESQSNASIIQRP